MSTPHDLGNGHFCYAWPNCSIHNPSVASLTAAFNRKVDKLNGRAQIPAIQSQTPAIIDDVLANLYYQEGRVLADISRHQESNRHYERRMAATTNDYVRRDYQRVMAENQAALIALEAKAADIRAEMVPGEAEFRRRGGWTRAFLVVNGNGHVHRSMNCSTCNNGAQATRFNWLTDYSGKNEAQVVDDAGRSACTTCYPSAPAETRNRASRIEDPDKRARRLEREKKAAAKRAKDEIEGIKNPDGSELLYKMFESDGSGRSITKEVTAERAAVDNIYNAEYSARYAQPGSIAARPATQQFHRDQLAVLVNALAHKRQQTPEEVRAALDIKVAAKRRREERGSR